jgi:hypothetical protein
VHYEEKQSRWCAAARCLTSSRAAASSGRQAAKPVKSFSAAHGGYNQRNKQTQQQKTFPQSVFIIFPLKSVGKYGFYQFPVKKNMRRR